MEFWLTRKGRVLEIMVLAFITVLALVPSIFQI